MQSVGKVILGNFSSVSILFKRHQNKSGSGTEHCLSQILYLLAYENKLCLKHVMVALLKVFKDSWVQKSLLPFFYYRNYNLFLSF